MRTTVVVFPFDLFGGAGTGAGAELLADELREVLADNRREKVPTRARAYTEHVRLHPLAFESLADYRDWRRRARRVVRRVLDRGDFLVWLSGNHLGVLPVYDELGPDALAVQLDAHLDIHHFADCTKELSHGNFLLHCERPPALINAGHRELLLPADYVGKHYRMAFPADALAVDPGPALAKVRRAARAAGRTFLDVDCDVFDPAYFPAVARPVPFGLSPQQVLRVLDAAWTDQVVGVALSEFDPGRDRDDQGLATLVWLLEYLLLRRYE